VIATRLTSLCKGFSGVSLELLHQLVRLLQYDLLPLIPSVRGTPIPEVSAMLGHANVNITLTVYTHFIPKMQTDSAANLAAAIFSSKKPVNDQVGHLKDTSEEKASVS
jgi:Aromatic amino acid lyase